jgi:uncharacterized protein YjdB
MWTNHARHDRQASGEAATRANPSKDGDAKLRGYGERLIGARYASRAAERTFFFGGLMRSLSHFLRSPIRILLGAVFAALVVVACVETMRPGVVVSISVTPNPVGLSVGSRSQLTAAALDAQGNPVQDATVTWSTSNPSVANVSGTGEVEALAAGSAIITAQAGQVSGTSTVNVTATAVPVATVTVSPASPSVQRGSTVQLTATVRDAGGNVLSDRAVSWSSSNNAAATVSGTGLVTGVAAGSATVTATSEGKSGSSTVAVTDPPPPPPPPAVASVTVAPTSATVERGSTVQLTATVRDASGNVLTGRAVSWTSSNTSAATVSGSGLVTGVAAGSATVSATSEGKSGSSNVTITEPPPPPPPPPPGSSATLLAAGDIAYCDEDGDEQTAALLDNLAGTIITLGDMAYEDGTLAEFQNCYGPSWGRHKARTRPSPGNHEYHSSNAQGYFDYFGAAAGEVGKGYYSFDLGDWHIIALNYYVSTSSSSPQITWLKADLAANQKKCVLAYWHRPRFSSGHHGSSTSPNAFVQPLYDAGADVVLVSHDHIYERFAPMRPDGTADAVRGIRHFTVGTGGAPLTEINTPVAGSEVRNNTAHGILKLTLRADGYDWQFVPVAGKTFTDTGSGTCH